MLNVVFLHAFPLDSRMWNPQLAAAPFDWRLHALNFPGFGQPRAEALPASMELLADAIHEEIRSLDQVVLCGCSMGGYAAMAYWRKYGHEGRLAGLVLADTRAEADSPEARAGRADSIRVVQEQGLPAFAERMLARLLSSHASAEVREEVRTMILEQAPEVVVAALGALRDRPDSTELLASIDVPVLLLGGEEDAITSPAVMQTMLARLPKATWRAVPEAGHLANIEQPAVFNQAVFGFLRSLPPG